MSCVCYTTDRSSSHDDHLYQNTQHWSPRQQLNLIQDISRESFTDLLMSSPLDEMLHDVLYNLPNADSSAFSDFGMVLTPDLTRLNPRFCPEPTCPKTSSISSWSHAQKHVRGCCC